MSFKDFIKNTCLKLGSNNKSIYPVMAVATANAIFRPTFTMLKKGENPETKKYAALRELITEIIAVPTYCICGLIAAKFGEKIAGSAMDKKILVQEKAGHVLTAEAKNEMRTTAIKKGQVGLMLMGVCFAAGVVIPALCSLLVTPIMSKIGKNKEKAKHIDIKENAVAPPKQLVLPKSVEIPNVYRNFNSSGIKVGAL